MMENKNILDMDYKIFSKIKNILEDQNVRESFLEVLPTEYCNSDLLTMINVEGCKPNASPAKCLLLYLGSRGICTSDLIQWFEEMHLEKALILLKKDEPLRIIQQPVTNMVLGAGAKLELTCKAISYPPPEYLWFKEEEMLLLQDEETLSISNVRGTDSGVYICRVLKKNTDTGDYVWLDSDPVEVTVTNDIEYLTEYKSPKILNGNTFNDEDSSLENNDVISILRHPYVHGKVGQGMSICLFCEAESIYPVQYQWYQDGRPLNGEKSSKLELKHLYPDSVTGNSKWKYQCIVYNEHDHVFSNPVTVELDDIDETTCFFAEEKIAFMVANDTYHNLEELKKPAVDVVDLAALLSSMEFKVFAFRNINLTEMKNALHVFCQTLRPNVYGLFYFAGHGFEECGQTYLLPVDCGSEFLKDEAICTEYVLQCMQDRNPDLNVLLIDACRQLPPLSNNSESSFPFKDLYAAKMGGNTIYGYSTSYLYSSYESDAEANSFFAKYLKRYLKQNKKIQDILMLVQQDFINEPLTKKLQYPLIKSSLATPRKLCDPVSKSISSNNILSWCSVKKPPICIERSIPALQISILITFCHHLNTFCNVIDAKVYMNIQTDAKLFILTDMELDITFKLTNKIIPTGSVSLKNCDLKVGMQKHLLTKTILDAQKIEDENISGCLILKFCKANRSQELPFSVNVVNIAKFKLFLNQFKSSNTKNSVKCSFNNDLICEDLKKL